MFIWLIQMGDRHAPLDTIDIPAIRAVTDPIRDQLATRLEPLADEGELTIIFDMGSDRSLSIRLRGDPIIVNRARDTLGHDQQIGPLLN